MPCYAPNKKQWTDEMLEKLRREFPVRFTIELATEWGMGLRTVIRKARELGIEKEEGFLDKRRKEIGQLAKKAKGPNPTKGMKGWSVPGGEPYRFTRDNWRPVPEDARKRGTEKRNKTIDRERLRLRYGLKQETALKLDPYAQRKPTK